MLTFRIFQTCAQTCNDMCRHNCEDDSLSVHFHAFSHIFAYFRIFSHKPQCVQMCAEFRLGLIWSDYHEETQIQLARIIGTGLPLTFTNLGSVLACACMCLQHVKHVMRCACIIMHQQGLQALDGFGDKTMVAGLGL